MSIQTNSDFKSAKISELDHSESENDINDIIQYLSEELLAKNR